MKLPIDAGMAGTRTKKTMMAPCKGEHFVVGICTHRWLWGEQLKANPKRSQTTNEKEEQNGSQIHDTNSFMVNGNQP